MRSEGIKPENYVLKALLWSVGILAFFAIVLLTFQIIHGNAPGMFGNCVQNLVLLAEKNESAYVTSEENGKIFLDSTLGGNYEFVSTTIYVCDPSYTGYIYKQPGNANDSTYVVCGDGEIYKYELVCADDKTGKFMKNLLKYEPL